MNKPAKIAGTQTVEDELAEMDAYESWRPALIAFYRTDGPWFQKIENLQRGEAFTNEDLRVIDCLIASLPEAPRLAA